MDFTLHSTFESIPASAWNALLPGSITDAPFLRHEYLATWWRTLGGGEWTDVSLALVSAHENGELIGIAPLFLKEKTLMLVGSVEISDYLDLIVHPEHLEPFGAGLLNWLTTHAPQPWSALDWVNIPENSPTLALLKTESAKRGWSYSEEIYQPTPTISLPGNFDAYLESLDKKQRHEVRRKMRRAEESGRGVRWYIVREAESLEAEMDAFIALMAHDPQKESFLTPAMRVQLKESAKAAFEAGYLQLAFLEADGEKACAYLNFDFANRIWVYNSGLDRKFMDLSPGWVLLGHLLQWANENKRSEFDFMRGDEEYKYRFGAVARHVLRVRVEQRVENRE